MVQNGYFGVTIKIIDHSVEIQERAFKAVKII